MDRRAFAICALGILGLELLALDRDPMPGPATAEIERIVAGHLRDGQRQVSDVRCVRRAFDEAMCVATLYEGARMRVSASIDSRSGRVESALAR